MKTWARRNLCKRDLWNRIITRFDFACKGIKFQFVSDQSSAIQTIRSIRDEMVHLLISVNKFHLFHHARVSLMMMMNKIWLYTASLDPSTYPAHTCFILLPSLVPLSLCSSSAINNAWLSPSKNAHDDKNMIQNIKMYNPTYEYKLLFLSLILAASLLYYHNVDLDLCDLDRRRKCFFFYSSCMREFFHLDATPQTPKLRHFFHKLFSFYAWCARVETEIFF